LLQSLKVICALIIPNNTIQFTQNFAYFVGLCCKNFTGIRRERFRAFGLLGFWAYSDSSADLLARSSDGIPVRFALWGLRDSSDDLLARSSDGIPGCSSLKFLLLGVGGQLGVGSSVKPLVLHFGLLQITKARDFHPNARRGRSPK
jgi:hypothetical protein